MIGTFHDITEGKQAEEKYRVLVETTNTGFLILNDEGNVIDANAEYVRLTGHGELRDILGKTVVEWTADYDQQRNAAAVVQCVKAGFLRNFVIDYVDKNGRITPIEVNAATVGTGETIHIVSLCRDITERRQAEAKLSEQLAELQRWQNVMIGREDRILKVKKEVNELLARLGEPPRYSSVE